MQYIIEGHNHEYETQTIIQVFRPNEKYARVREQSEKFCVLSRIDSGSAYAAIYENGSAVAENAELLRDTSEKEAQRAVKTAIFRAFCEYDNVTQPWGIMTGIRPAKIINDFWREGLSEAETRTRLTEDFLLSDKKIELAITVAKNEAKVLAGISQNENALYVGVPFCPSKCLYCSFTSYPAARYEKKMDVYFAAFEKEMKCLGDNSQNDNTTIIYVGGGTPSALNDYYFEKLLAVIAENFPLNAANEFTVESGRPDSTTIEKLKIMKRYGVTRVSVNPQTLNEQTLTRIGRAHTPREFFTAYENAGNAGFLDINVDLIVGLPGESLADIENTLRQVEKLSPSSVTVHTLAVKRAARLNRSLSENTLSSAEEVEKALALAEKYTKSMGLRPYYMYRQKNMLGNFENVGYCRDGFECAYNVCAMEEVISVLAAGAGAVTKIVSHGSPGNKITRLFNPKGIEDYISRIDEIIKEKSEL
ncbi:coproporphyrinogen III oxidase [Clostridia bacterium]|nr:coproporphyrinogen III oxidase [Clostridia bacterium]